MKRGKEFRKYVSVVIAALTVITVFSVMSTGSAQTLSGVNSLQTLTKTVEISMNDVRYVSSPDGHYIVVKGLRLSGIPGSPMLPVKNLQFNLPKHAKVISVSVDTGTPINYGFAKISPAKAPVLKNGYKIPDKYTPPAVNKAVYNTNSFYPQKNMIYSVDNAWNGTIVDAHLFPVKYNPVTEKVIIYPTIRVTVTYQVEKVRASSAPIDVPNIIITSPELKAQAQRLADFHNSTGVDSWVVTTDWIANNFQPAGNPPVNGYGNSTTDPYSALGNWTFPLEKSMIKGYNYTLARKIIAFLQNESNGNNVTYITIFGNARMVPPSYYYDDQLWYLIAYFGWYDYYDAWIPTDAMYASPNYNSTHFDYIPTFMVGRIPVNNITAKQVVDKIIYYAQHKTRGIQNVTLSGGQVFETPYFLGETGVTEPMNFGWLDGTNITEYFHTLRNFTYNNFVSMMNNSDMILEVTHGSGFSFWHHNDEISAWDFPMKGTYGSLPVCISGSCLNGAWDEEMYPAYEMSWGINGGTSIAEQMLYSPKGIIAYFGADRIAYGSTYTYFDNGTLVAPNDFGDLITEDGTIAGYYIGTAYYGNVTLGMMAYYAHAEYAWWIPWLGERDPFGDGLNDNPWARSYFEYSLLGDPALKVAGSGPNNPSYSLPQAIIPNATYDSSDMPIITRGQAATVNINSTSPTVKAELLYIEQDYWSYYDFILNTTTLTPVSSHNGLNNFTYTFTPDREGLYMLSIYGEDGKNTRFYMDCQMPQPPSIHLALKDMKFMHIRNTENADVKANAPDVQVITLIDYEQVAYGKTTNVTAVVYNSGNAVANNVKVQFYLENYTLIFWDENLSYPLVWLGNVTISSLAPGEFVYATLPWKAVNLWVINHTWDPYNSSARWQYVVANAVVSGDSNTSNNANWALFRVHLKLDVWAQKVFIEKDPVYNESNNVTFELTNVGTSEMSNTTVYVMDDYETFAVLPNINIAPGQTVFYTIPWTPHYGGYDEIYVQTVTPGDNNTMNNVSMYYTNGYYGISWFMVLTYDVAPVNASVKLTSSGNSMEIGVGIYNYGPLESNATSMDVYLYGGTYSTDVESPHPYPNNYDHTWEINAPNGVSGMALHFAYLNVEPDYDYVIIYDQNWSLVAWYTGFYSDLWTDYIQSSKVYVELWSDEFGNYSGFKIDAIATQDIYVGHVDFAPLASGSFAQTTLTSTHVLSGQIAVKMVSTTPWEYATLSTGGNNNNIKIISRYIPYTLKITSYSPTGVVDSREPVITINYYDKVYSEFKYINITIDGVKIPSYRVQITGTTSGTITAEVPFMLADGEHEVRVTLVDQGGNTNSTSWMFTVDAILSSLEITSPSNGAVLSNSDVTISWSGSDSTSGIDHYEVRIDNGSWINAGTATQYTFTSVSDGTHTVDVKAVDVAGNNVTVTVSFTVDTTAPTLEITSPSNGYLPLTYNKVMWINGTTDPNATVTINGISVAVDSNGDFSYKATLVEGKNVFTVTATDSAGNSVTKTVTALYLSQLSEIQNKNTRQDNGISTNQILGWIGIILAIIALIIGIAALVRKPKTSVSYPVTPSGEEKTVEEESKEEENREAENLKP